MGTPTKTRETTDKGSDPHDKPGERPAAGKVSPTEDTQKPPKKKFKFTRQLVQIALDDGMTQNEIAAACRTQQSVVSKWKKGESRGTEEQLDKLIKKYGPRLNRTTSRVYLAAQDPSVRWEETEFGKHLATLAERSSKGANASNLYSEIRHAWQSLMPVESDRHVELKELVRTYRELFLSLGPIKAVQVEGPIIFRYSFCRLGGRLDRRGVDVERVPVARWILHDGQLGKFVLVRQFRRALLGEEQKRWMEEVRTVQEYLRRLRERVSVGETPILLPSYWVESAEDAAKWICQIEVPMTIEELIQFVRTYLQDVNQIHNPHDEAALPFLLRKALVEHGHQVPGVEKISGYG
jgi:transcriptional regulator with XRE-family HTH domain